MTDLSQITRALPPQQPQVMIGVDQGVSTVINGSAIMLIAAQLYAGQAYDTPPDERLSMREACDRALTFYAVYNEAAVAHDEAKKVAQS